MSHDEPPVHGVTATPIIDIRPEINEIAVVNLPVGQAARVHHPSGPRVWAPPPGERLIAEIPCDNTHIGWGVVITSYIAVGAIRNGRHRRDRAVWHEAARAVRRQPVVYVAMDQREYYGRHVWTAISVRTESSLTPNES
jgi:hypothetical protein